MRRSVCIVGGGVVGLTCAEVLADDFDVIIVADRVGAESASIVATAIWHVYLVDKDDSSTLTWSRETLEKLLEIADTSPEAGVSLVRGVELFRKSDPHLPTWAHIPPFFEMLSADEVAAFAAKDDPQNASALPIRWGYRIAAPAATMEKYLPWLNRRILAKGVRLVERRLASLEEASEYGELIINCSGYGARLLAPDAGVIPVKGQYVVYEAGPEGPTEYLGDDDHPVETCYLIPRAGQVIIGGTEEYDEDSDTFTRSTDELIDRIAPFEPWVENLRSMAPSRIRVGVRPYRTEGVLLGLDETRAMAVIHNIGHGGSGFSLSWGCANAVRDLARRHFDMSCDQSIT